MGQLPRVVVVRCARALLPGGWRDDVEVVIDPEGRIEGVSAGAEPDPGAVPLDGWVLPGLPNLHAHAFQRGLVGRTEHRDATRPDSFWTWREAMYRLAETLDLDELGTLARVVYAEMLEAGYTQVGEFQYLHQAAGGAPHPAPGAATRALAEAARDVGVGFTALPVLYLHGGFDAAPPEPRQGRFVSRGVQAFLRIFADARASLGAGQRVGVAPHSLRAVDLEAMAEVLSEVERRVPEAPVHVHVAEQPAEVEACRAALGRRPVEALLEALPVGPRWCLVHATHTTEAELTEIARREAVVGLCPTTEANLGDGSFPLGRFLELGGRFGVGSDSQATVDPAEELRWLEYQARLASGRRNLLALDGAPPHVGRTLYVRAGQGGAQALGAPAWGIRPGAPAELVALDAEHPRLAGLRGDAVLDGWILGSARGAVHTVWRGVQRVVEGGRHVARERIDAAWRALAPRLGERLG